MTHTNATTFATIRQAPSAATKLPWEVEVLSAGNRAQRRAHDQETRREKRAVERRINEVADLLAPLVTG